MKRVIEKGALGTRIRDMAQRKNILLSTLERQAGYSVGMISRWVTAGTEDFNVLAKLVTMADLLDVSMDELVGREFKLAQADEPGPNHSSSPLPHLLAATRSGALKWKFSFVEDVLPPTLLQEHSRALYGGWQVRVNNLKFLLAVFCDDFQDDDEVMELSLYCLPGHQLPPSAISSPCVDDLAELYTLIAMSDALGDPSSAPASESVSTVKSPIPFRVQNG